ncbi:Fc.00g042790.m01.CDS01 [Cosmosporella sp. VM-42]
MARRGRSAKVANPPAAISDEESSDAGEVAIPVRRGRKPASRSVELDLTADDVEVTNGDVVDEHDESEGEEGEGEDEEDLDEDVFIVEAIKKHTIFEDGTLKFQVKWEGYDSKKDLTWEPEENLKESATEILAEYFTKIGGRDKIFEETEKAVKGKKRGRPQSGTPSTTSKRSRQNGVHPSDTTPPKSAMKWSPPAGSWEDEIETIDACEDEGSGKLVVYLIWKNGSKTKHDTQVIYKKCPQKMLQFYERHVKIIREENKALADEGEC